MVSPGLLDLHISSLERCFLWSLPPFSPATDFCGSTGDALLQLSAWWCAETYQQICLLTSFPLIFLECHLVFLKLPLVFSHFSVASVPTTLLKWFPSLPLHIAKTNVALHGAVSPWKQWRCNVVFSFPRTPDSPGFPILPSWPLLFYLSVQLCLCVCARVSYVEMLDGNRCASFFRLSFQVGFKQTCVLMASKFMFPSARLYCPTW